MLGGRRSAFGQRFDQRILGELAPALSYALAGPTRCTRRVTPSASRKRQKASHTPPPRYSRLIFPCSPIRSEGLPAKALPL